MKNDGVPVLDKVAAILRQIRPDFPNPVTTTLPRHAWSNSTALTKLSSRRSTSEAIPFASILRTSLARCRIIALFTSGLPFQKSVNFFNHPDKPLEFLQWQGIRSI